MSQRLKSNPTEQRIIYPSFDGGLNLSVPPESLNRNELREALNVEYSASTGAMTVRGGLFHHAYMGVKAAIAAPIPGHRGFLVTLINGGTPILFTWNRTESVTGYLTGSGEISVCEWDGDYLIASGGKLQRLRTRYVNELETIESSPSRCQEVFVRSGRVWVVTDENTIKLSGVGDCENWRNDPNDESSSQYLEIGYKDGMNIDAVIPLSRDLIVFKSPENEPDKGIIFRVTGDFPEWTVLEAAHNIGTFSRKSVQAVGNDVYFATLSGVASLSSVTEYGEIKARWPDQRVSAVLSKELSADAEIWHIPVKQQIWVKAHKGTRKIWVLDYGRGIWTKFEYPGEVLYSGCSSGAVYLIIGASIYEEKPGKVTDTNETRTKERAIAAKMEMGTLLTGNQILVRRAFVSFGIQPECRAKLKLGDFRMDFSHDTTREYVYGNDSPVSGNDKKISGTKMAITSRRMCIVRGWSVTPEVEMTGGGCALSTMGLEIAEV